MFEIGFWTYFLAVLAGVYLYYRKKHSYWSSRGVPGPTPLPVLGNFLPFFMRSTAEVEMDWYRKYGKVFGTYEGADPVLYLADPGLLKQVMVKDFNLFPNRRPAKTRHTSTQNHLLALNDEAWKRVRSVVTPTFTSGKMKRMYPLMDQCVSGFLGELGRQADRGLAINIKSIYTRLTVDVIANCAYGVKTKTFDPTQKTPSPFEYYSLNFRNKSNVQKVLYTMMPLWMSRSLGIDEPLKGDVIAFFDHVAEEVIKQRRSNPEEASRRDDLMQLMINSLDGGKSSPTDEAADEQVPDHEAYHGNEGAEEMKVFSKVMATGSGTANGHSNGVQKSSGTVPSSGRHMTEAELMGQAFVFFIAGFETTSNLLSWSSLCLAKYPETEERLYNEIKSLVKFDTDGREVLDYETLTKAPYLDAVIGEVLRLYDPVARLDRRASTNYTIPHGKGIPIDRGVLVNLPFYVLHHSEEFFPDPMRFDPERFLPENRDKLTPYTYLPFGAGPRNCVGMRFALLEGKLALARTVLNFKFSVVPETEESIKLSISSVGVSAVNGPILKVTRRIPPVGSNGVKRG